MKTILLLLTILLWSGCGKKESNQPEPQGDTSVQVTAPVVEQIELSKLVVETPREVLSAKAKSISISFSENMVEQHRVSKVLSKNPFTFSPPVKGHAIWASRKSLYFMPSDRLEPGTTYTGTLSGTALFGEQKCSDSVTFTFTAAPQEVISFSYDFEPVVGSKNSVRLKAEFAFAEPVDTAKFRKDVSLLIKDEKKSSLGFSAGYGKTQRYLVVESKELVRTPKAQNFQITLPKEYTPGDGRWEQLLTLPGGTVFTALYHGDNSDPERGIVGYSIAFSDPIRTDMDISGFISVTPEVEYSVTVQGKQLILDGSFEGGVEYTIRVDSGFGSVFGTTTTKPQVYRAILENRKPEIEWLSDGVFLPDNNKSKLQFRSINVAKAIVTVHEIYKDNMGFFLQENALVQTNSNSDYYYYRSSDFRDLQRVGEQIYYDTIEIDTVKNSWVRSEIDLSKISGKRKGSALVVKLSFTQQMLTGTPVDYRDGFAPGMLYYESDGYYTNPANSGYYYRHGAIEKLMIKSNVALSVKESNTGYHITAINVQTALPESDSKIALYNYQNKLLARGKSDSNGYVHLTVDSGAIPHHILGDSPSGPSYLRLSDRSWNLSTFDVNGSAVQSDGSELFLYTDRGVHRPGDTIFLSGILRMNRRYPPENLPVKLTVTNAMGNTVLTENGTAGRQGHWSWTIPTESGDPTGNWHVKVTVGDKEFHRTLPVETIKPNRLKVEYDIASEQEGNSISGALTTRYLFGTPASGLEASVYATVSSKEFHPKGYDEYRFVSPIKKYSQRWVNLFEGSLDDSGRCSFSGTVEGTEQAPALLSAALSLRVHEKGGSVVEKRYNTTISPYDYYVGIKDPFRWGSALIGERHDVPVVVTDKKGKPVSGRKLKVRVYINRRYWWWDYDNRNSRDFRSLNNTYKVMDKELITNDQGITVPVTIEDYGRHYIEVTDVESGHETGFFFYGSRWASDTRNGSGEETYLPVALNQNVYQPGDLAEISCDAPDSAMAILTIEQDKKILDRQWAVARNGKISFTVPVTEQMMPNCYAAVQLIQPHNQTTNDLPLSQLGIVTIPVEDAATHLPISLSTPKEIRPGETFSLSVSNNSKEKITATVTVVDEGLLDLTDFVTPNPWKHFYRKLRLAITTRDNFGAFIGALLPDMDKLFSIGGDSAEEDRSNRTGDTEAKRFKPVVLVEKPVTINPGETHIATFTMPNYVGEVRAMIVAAGEQSFTSTSEQIPVKQPLMILPTLPRTIRPGDRFDLPVSIFAMDSTIKSATVHVTSSGGLNIEHASETVKFSSPSEKDVSFALQAGDRVGVDTVTVTAVSGVETTSVVVELPMQSPNPYYTEVTESTVVSKGTLLLKPTPFGYEGTNSARITISRAPDIQIEKRLDDLIRYPYGCLEQTTSSVFPQLFLTRLTPLSKYRSQQVTRNINSGISRLRSFMAGSRYSYWPRSRYYGSYYNNWAGLYASHFLIEAASEGYVVPSYQKKHLKGFLQTQSKSTGNSYSHQSYALFLLARDGSPNMGKMNLLKENYLSKMDDLSVEFLATAYALAGKNDIASELVRELNNVREERELSGTFRSMGRDLALFTYLATLRNDEKRATKLLGRLAEQFRPGQWRSTHETGMALLAVATYYNTFGKNSSLAQFDIEYNGTRESVTLHKLQQTFDLDNFDGKVKVISQSESPLYVSLAVAGVPKEDRIKNEANGVALTRVVYNEDGYEIGLNQLKQGEPVWVLFKVKSSWSAHLNEIALSMVIPAGWEIVNTRLTGERPPEWLGNVTQPTYSDIRDDRINWFFNLNSYSTQRYAVKVIPSFSGTYTLPPVVLETMYSPDYYAHLKSGLTTVTKR